MIYGVQNAVAQLQSQQTNLGSATRLDGESPSILVSPPVARRFEALEKEMAKLRGQLRMSGVTLGNLTFD